MRVFYAFFAVGCVSVLSEQWYASLVGRFHLNAFKLQPLSLLATAWQGGGSQLAQAASQAVLGEGSVGTGIYLLPSFLNHDCGTPLVPAS